MHSPTPYGLDIIGGSITDKDAAFIRNAMAKAKNIMDISGIESLNLTKALPDGGSVRLINSGGIRKAIVRKSSSDYSKQDEIEVKPWYEFDVPILFSGVFPYVDEYSMNDELPPQFNISEQTRRRLNDYLSPIEDEVVYLQKFRVPYASAFKFFCERTNQDKGELQYQFAYDFQYQNLKSSWYSGAMAGVVQIISGYGAQTKGQIQFNASGPITSEYETKKLFIPEDVRQNISEEMAKNDGILLIPTKGVPAQDGQIRYDFRFENTDCIAFDDINEPWLVNISSNGIKVMPLPVIPATKTQAFKDYIISVNDDELLYILEKYKGIPTGEGFPNGDELTAWETAGYVRRINDTKDFYEFYAHADSLGWAMNESGTEAMNTCWDYYAFENNKPVSMTGYTYKLNINLKSFDIPDRQDYQPQKKSKIRSYLNNIKKGLNLSSSKDRAILFKLKYASNDELFDRAQWNFFILQDEYDFWLQKQMSIGRNHFSNFSRTDSGMLVAPKYERGGSNKNVLSLPDIYSDRRTLGHYLGDNPSVKLARIYDNSIYTKYPDFTQLETKDKDKWFCSTNIIVYYKGDIINYVKYEDANDFHSQSSSSESGIEVKLDDNGNKVSTHRTPSYSSSHSSDIEYTFPHLSTSYFNSEEFRYYDKTSGNVSSGGVKRQDVPWMYLVSATEPFESFASILFDEETGFRVTDPPMFTSNKNDFEVVEKVVRLIFDCAISSTRNHQQIAFKSVMPFYSRSSFILWYGKVTSTTSTRGIQEYAAAYYEGGEQGGEPAFQYFRRRKAGSSYIDFDSETSGKFLMHINNTPDIKPDFIIKTDSSITSKYSILSNQYINISMAGNINPYSVFMRSGVRSEVYSNEDWVENISTSLYRYNHGSQTFVGVINE